MGAPAALPSYGKRVLWMDDMDYLVYLLDGSPLKGRGEKGRERERDSGISNLLRKPMPGTYIDEHRDPTIIKLPPIERTCCVKGRGVESASWQGDGGIVLACAYTFEIRYTGRLERSSSPLWAGRVGGIIIIIIIITKLKLWRFTSIYLS
ncbi:hypothetical protein F5X96DRAFT_641839 [Biscogniauxia mediterranea]|nr:hypothetical protein F5X96DRAFT_641839 [Biscogniauxia mediterranea]